MSSPHPLSTIPQVAPSSAQVLGAQQVPAAVQTSVGFGQPQLTVDPQVSSKVPHRPPKSAHVLGVQQLPRWQTAGSSHGPHWIGLPQVSSVSPQAIPSSPQVLGTQGVQRWPAGMHSERVPPSTSTLVQSYPVGQASLQVARQ
jgi:hypothetical protein